MPLPGWRSKPPDVTSQNDVPDDAVRAIELQASISTTSSSINRLRCRSCEFVWWDKRSNRQQSQCSEQQHQHHQHHH